MKSAESLYWILKIASVVVPVAIVSWLWVWRHVAIPVQKVLAQFDNNGGSSLRDAIDKIAIKQDIIMQATGTAFWESDPEGFCVHASRQLADMMGCHPEDILGLGWARYVSPEERDSVKAEWLQCVKDKRQFSLEYHFKRKDGTKMLITGTANPVIVGEKVTGWFGWAESKYPPERRQSGTETVA